jgi:hypothetical protein
MLDSFQSKEPRTLNDFKNYESKLPLVSSNNIKILTLLFQHLAQSNIVGQIFRSFSADRLTNYSKVTISDSY